MTEHHRPPTQRPARTGDIIAIELPHSEVCTHLRVAGQIRTVEVLEHAAQILDEQARPYSLPIPHAEAGLHPCSTCHTLLATVHTRHTPDGEVAPTPGRAGLSVAVTALAGQVGYDLEPDELIPTAGHHPDLVTRWASLAAHHIALAWTRAILDDTIALLTDVTDGDPDGPDEHHLRRLRGHHRALTRALDTGRERFRRACADLADTRTGLLWPRADPAPGTPPDPPATTSAIPG